MQPRITDQRTFEIERGSVRTQVQVSTFESGTRILTMGQSLGVEAKLHFEPDAWAEFQVAVADA